MLLRNLDPSKGLCNGTRLICKRFLPHVLDAEITSGSHIGERVLLPRIALCTMPESGLPFTMRRRQFPVRSCFAMTINKAQGQTLRHVGLYLPQHVFSHGQLYVAMSRVCSPESLSVLVNGQIPDKEGIFTRNVVFLEVLD